MRLMRENEGNKDLSKHSRWHTDLSFKHKMNRFGISYRFRFQQKSSISENYLPINKMRFRLKTSYNIKDWKWDPYFTSELFHIQKRISIETNEFCAILFNLLTCTFCRRHPKFYPSFKSIEYKYMF